MHFLGVKSIMTKSILLLFAIFVISGCATRHIGPSDAPPTTSPIKPFSSFTNVYLKTTDISESYRFATGAQAAIIKIDENMVKEMHDVFRNVQSYDTMETRKYSHDQKAEDVLIIKPFIEKIKFVSGERRVLFGAFAGSSAVVLRVDFIDGNKNVVSSPKFYQRAQAMGGGFSFGTTDNTMLFRIAKEASAYVRNHY